jgi:hypothetical protein
MRRSAQRAMRPGDIYNKQPREVRFSLGTRPYRAEDVPFLDGLNPFRVSCVCRVLEKTGVFCMENALVHCHLKQYMVNITKGSETT